MLDKPIEHGFKEGDKVCVEDDECRHHPGIFVGDNESAGCSAAAPAPTSPTPRPTRPVVSLFRITLREK